MIAALYVDPRGPYPRMAGVDAWDVARDATTYAGPHSVVAHPPCGPWGKLRHLSRHDDPRLAPIAVRQVRRWGGVLEHPAGSKLWDACHLPRPGVVDAWGGVTIEVCQVDWGHACRKRTWLYIVGATGVHPIAPTGRQPTHWIAGNTGQARAAGCLLASREIARRTPPAFAQWLVGVAASCRVVA